MAKAQKLSSLKTKKAIIEDALRTVTPFFSIPYKASPPHKLLFMLSETTSHFFRMIAILN